MKKETILEKVAFIQAGKALKLKPISAQTSSLKKVSVLKPKEVGKIKMKKTTGTGVTNTFNKRLTKSPTLKPVNAKSTNGSLSLT